jgi:orotate phosphoribosyltransferase-like protein
MHYLKTGLAITIPLINIQKIPGKIPIPQKSLSSLGERINNANTTFTIPEEQRYNKILLIDDAVGSGATLNQIAKKIKEKGTSSYIIGLAIVGSFKGFDVITDV